MKQVFGSQRCEDLPHFVIVLCIQYYYSAVSSNYLKMAQKSIAKEDPGLPPWTKRAVNMETTPFTTLSRYEPLPVQQLLVFLVTMFNNY